MWINITVLFFVALLGGLAAFRYTSFKPTEYKLPLVFAGAYLFSITLIHLFPELYASTDELGEVGVYVLIGFFLQQVLEYFTAGAEHGHVHLHEDKHAHAQGSAFSLIIALSVHAFLEGSLLAHGSSMHALHNSNTLLVGIAVHKIPAAFAMMTILLCQYKNTRLPVIMLLVFALASPVGLILSDYVVGNALVSQRAFILITALVSGNFLHISTTIVFESSTEHKFEIKRLLVSILGAVVAILAESMF